ncbi:MAG TPA: poly(R)-hydroxyalkanoic acid synthase subunit PhaE [Casimicrobiaceae bacterium]|jgi:hypothetical protein
MTFDPAQAAQSVYNFWLGLVPQFLGQLGQPVSGSKDGASGMLDGLMFPMDQFAKAAAATQQSWQSMAQAMTPSQPGVANAFAPWIAGASSSSEKAGAAAAPARAAEAMFAPWTALMSTALGAQAANAPPSGALGSSVLPLQAMGLAWIDAASRLVGATPAQFTAAFERTYGALSDALGLGPAREFQSAWQEMLAAGLAQQEARAHYGMLVQGALAEGLQRLTARLADKAAAGERIDSVLALMRLWAVTTEEAVHETLQSEKGLAATAALARSALAHRKRMRHVAAIAADLLDVATRRELDEAYREIQALKRELRALRPPAKPARAPSTESVAQRGGSKARRRGSGLAKERKA